MKILRNLFKVVTCDQRSRRFFGDEILHAEPVPKLMLMPMTWRGDLRPVLDAYLEQLAPLTNGLTLGRTLSAEEIPHVLDIGTAWLGSFSDRMLAARDEKPGALDASEVFGQLQHLRRQMGTGNPQALADGVRRVRDAARLLSDEAEEPHGAFSGGRRIADGLMRRHHTGDFSRPVSIAQINQRNRTFASRDVTPRLDDSGRMNWRTGDAAPPTAFRDAMHAAGTAATPREQIAALNRGAKAFWNRGEPPSLTADMLRQPAPTTVAGINARNRHFWASRS